MGANRGTDSGRGGCLLLLGIALVLLVGVAIYNRMGGNVAREPEPRPTPGAQEAIIYVAGSEGGSFVLTWKDVQGSVKGQEAGVIGNRPLEYRIDLSRVNPDHNALYVEAYKSEDWEGTLFVALKVDNAFVKCQSTTETESRDFLGDPNAKVDVNAYSLYPHSFWEADWFCRPRLWYY